jgi:hypothetical protein
MVLREPRIVSMTWWHFTQRKATFVGTAVPPQSK